MCGGGGGGAGGLGGAPHGLKGAFFEQKREKKAQNF